MFVLILCLVLFWLNSAIAKAINSDQMYNSLPVNIAIVIGYLMYLIL